MAHHRSTPQSILDAPRLTPDPLWVTRITTPVTTGNLVTFHTRVVNGPFVGDVERDLLRVTVGTSRKGRKIRRAVTA